MTKASTAAPDVVPIGRSSSSRQRRVKHAQGEDRQEPGEERQHLGDEAAQPAEHQPAADEQEDDDVERGEAHGD